MEDRSPPKLKQGKTVVFLCFKQLAEHYYTSFLKNCKDGSFIHPVNDGRVLILFTSAHAK